MTRTFCACAVLAALAAGCGPTSTMPPCKPAIVEVPPGSGRGCDDPRHHATARRTAGGHTTYTCTCPKGR